MSLSDDAFLESPPPVAVEEGATAPSSAPAAVVVETPEVVQPVAEQPAPEVEQPAAEPVAVVEQPASAETPEQDLADDQFDATGAPSTLVPAPEAPAAPEGEKTEPVVEAPVVKKPETIEELNAFHAEALAPLAANGKTIELKNIAELRQLASMGANFTKKMQDIAPHRKILAMLEKNGMLDEAKLSLYIDVEQKNPQAVAQLLKNVGVDPLDIDTNTESSYQVGNHAPTDKEMVFRSALEDLTSTPTGQETVSVINRTWDQASKDLLWENPEVMTTIRQHRDLGIYAKITTEIERRTTLGQIPAGTAFIAAYKHVGDEMQAQGAFNNLVAPNGEGVQNTAPQTPAVAQQPVATRVVAPKPQVTNSAAATAAAATRPAQKRITPVASLDSLSDEEFLKQWSSRV